jgi:hypothetical protein
MGHPSAHGHIHEDSRGSEVPIIDNDMCEVDGELDHEVGRKRQVVGILVSLFFTALIIESPLNLL